MQVFTNRYLEFSNRIIAKHSGFGYYYDSISLLFPEEEKAEMSNEYGKKDSITNLYQIQYLQEHNHLFQKNISFVTKLFTQKVNQTLLPTIEQQAAKIISKELTGVSYQVLEKITKEYIEKATMSEEKNVELMQTLVNRFVNTQQQISNQFILNENKLADVNHDIKSVKEESATQAINKSQSQSQVLLINQSINNFQNQGLNQNQSQNQNYDQKSEQKSKQKTDQEINQITDQKINQATDRKYETDQKHEKTQNITIQNQIERNWNRVVRSIENILISNNQTTQSTRSSKINMFEKLIGQNAILGSNNFAETGFSKNVPLDPSLQQERVPMSHVPMNDLFANENVGNKELQNSVLQNIELRELEKRNPELQNDKIKNSEIRRRETKNNETKNMDIINTETFVFPVRAPKFLEQKQENDLEQKNNRIQVQKELHEQKKMPDNLPLQNQELDLIYTKSENDRNLSKKTTDSSSIKNQQKEQVVHRIINAEPLHAMKFEQEKNNSIAQKIQAQYKLENQKNKLSKNQELLKLENNTPILRTIENMILTLEHHRTENFQIDQGNTVNKRNINNGNTNNANQNNTNQNNTNNSIITNGNTDDSIINNNITNHQINRSINNHQIITTNANSITNTLNVLNRINNTDIFNHANKFSNLNDITNNQISNQTTNNISNGQTYVKNQGVSLILPEEPDVSKVKEEREKQIPTVIRQTIRQITREIERQQNIENRYIIGHERIEGKMSNVLQQFLNQEISKTQVQKEMVSISNDYQVLVYQTVERSKKSQDYIKKGKVQFSKTDVQYSAKINEYSVDEKKFGKTINLVYEKETDEIEKEKKHDQKLIRDTKEEIFQDIQFLKSTEIKTEQKTQEQKIIQDMQEMKFRSKSKEIFVEEQQQHNRLQKEIRETISQQVDESINVIANRVYNKLESRLKSERNRRGLN